MTQLVVDGEEVLAGDLNAHFQAHVVGEVDIPGAGMADDVSVGRLEEERALPKSWWQRGESEREEEALAIFHHLLIVGVLFLQQGGEIVAWVGAWGRHQWVDVAPILSPEVAEEVGRNGTAGGHEIAVFFVQARAHIGV